MVVLNNFAKENGYPINNNGSAEFNVFVEIYKQQQRYSFQTTASIIDNYSKYQCSELFLDEPKIGEILGRQSFSEKFIDFTVKKVDIISFSYNNADISVTLI